MFLGRFFSDSVRKRVKNLGLFESLKKRKQILLVRGKFSFPYVDNWFDVIK